MLWRPFDLDDVLDRLLTTLPPSTDLVALAQELADLEVVTVGTMAVLGIDGDQVFQAVHEANMSKLPLTRRDDGKILKSPNYQSADLEIARVVFA